MTLSKEDLKKLNPWNNFKETDQFLREDLETLEKENNKKSKSILKKIKWTKEDDGDAPNHEYQFPHPINGNFWEAKYILLYSNPACEQVELKLANEKDGTESLIKSKLLKCFRLDDDAELVREQWIDKQLERFFIYKENEKFNEKEFFKQFCFINYFPYATKKNEYNLECQLEVIEKLPSVTFINELVKYAKEKSSGKEVIIIRTTDGVWKNNVFDSLKKRKEKEAAKEKEAVS